jgi:membrane-associated phospholipid phosphatase
MLVHSWVLCGALLVAGVSPSTALGQNAPASPEIGGRSATTQTTTDAQQAASQTPAAGTKPVRAFFPALIHNLGDDVKHIPRRNSMYWLGGGAALALAVHPADKDLNSHLVGHSNPFVAGEVIGETATILGASAATYLVGRMKSYPRVQHLGMDEIEATLLAEGIAQGAKQIFRRDRPTLADGTKQSGFSFPSGHATLTFAAATVLQQHLGYRAGIPTYLVASYVAVSRLHDNRHYASDVAMGAAIGIIIGRSVTWHGRNFYGSLIPGGVGVTVTARSALSPTDTAAVAPIQIR